MKIRKQNDRLRRGLEEHVESSMKSREKEKAGKKKRGQQEVHSGGTTTRAPGIPGRVGGDGGRQAREAGKDFPEWKAGSILVLPRPSIVHGNGLQCGLQAPAAKRESYKLPERKIQPNRTNKTRSHTEG